MTSFAEPTHRPARGCRLRLGARVAQVLIAPPHTVQLLGGVDEQEEQCERACRDGAKLEGEGRDVVEQLVERRRARIGMAPGPTGAAKLLYRIECLVPLEPADDAAECRGKAADTSS
jgi:hypothetical protein